MNLSSLYIKDFSLDLSSDSEPLYHKILNNHDQFILWMDIKIESNLIIIFSYFDEVYGPQILDIFPKGQYQNFRNITQILSVLIDVSAMSEEENWYFLYSDQNFASQNLRMSIFNPDARGGISDLLISLIMQPSHPEHMAALSNNWNNIYSLQELIAEKITFEGNIPQFYNENLEEIMLSAHSEVVEQFQFFLDALYPGQHEIKKQPLKF
jgi:hypothetical protein